jgi:penicillin-binding protein 1A
MTGGSLPAMLWKEIMAFAHQDIEILPMPGFEEGEGLRVADTGPVPGVTASANRRSNTSLSRRSFEVVSGINHMFEVAERPARGFTDPRRITTRDLRVENAPGGFRQVSRSVGRP